MIVVQWQRERPPIPIRPFARGLLQGRGVDEAAREDAMTSPHLLPHPVRFVRILVIVQLDPVPRQEAVFQDEALLTVDAWMSSRLTATPLNRHGSARDARILVVLVVISPLPE